MKFYEIPCDEIGYFREEYDFLSVFCKHFFLKNAD